MTWLSILLFLLKWGPTIYQIIKNLPDMIKMIVELFALMRGLSYSQRVLQTKKLEVIFADARNRGKTVSTDSLKAHIEPAIAEWKLEVERLKAG